MVQFDPATDLDFGLDYCYASLKYRHTFESPAWAERQQRAAEFTMKEGLYTSSVFVAYSWANKEIDASLFDVVGKTIEMSPYSG